MSNYLHNTIKLYKDSKYSNRHGLDILLTIILIFISITAIIYFYIINNLQLLRNNWNEYKCNPFYFPFVNIINPKPGVSSDTQIKNLIDECINNNINNVSEKLTKGFYNSYNDFLNTGFSFTSMYSNAMLFFNWLSGLIVELVIIVVNSFLKIMKGTYSFGLLIQNLLNKFIGVLIITYYVIINIFNIGMAFVLNISYMITILILIPLIVTLSMLILIAIMIVVLALIYFPFGSIPIIGEYFIFVAVGLIIVGVIWLTAVIFLIVCIIIVSILIVSFKRIENHARNYNTVK